MNVYKQLNQLVGYVEDNIENELHPEVLTRFLHTNVYTAGKIFLVIAGQSFSEYVRKRRLSLAGQDLYSGQARVVELAVKYGYNNATAFSRAFEKFHGVKPSQITKSTKLKNFPRLVFDENIRAVESLNYEIIALPAFELYGISVDTNNAEISHDAPTFFQKVIREYVPIYGAVCLWEQKIPTFEQLKIPASKWLKFIINSENACDIQAMSQQFYGEFLPSCKYTLRELPELEYYHDGITDFLVAIE